MQVRRGGKHSWVGMRDLVYLHAKTLLMVPEASSNYFCTRRTGTRKGLTAYVIAPVHLAVFSEVDKDTEVRGS